MARLLNWAGLGRLVRTRWATGLVLPAPELHGVALAGLAGCMVSELPWPKWVQMALQSNHTTPPEQVQNGWHLLATRFWIGNAFPVDAKWAQMAQTVLERHSWHFVATRSRVRGILPAISE